MNKERKESEKVKNDIEDIQEVLEKHAEDIQTGTGRCIGRGPFKGKAKYILLIFQ